MDYFTTDGLPSGYLTDSKGIITLVGSTRFWDDYIAANRLLTLQGWIVLSCGHFGNSYHKALDVPELNEQCKILHFIKIEMSDAVCLVNQAHIGTSTTRELDWAATLGLPVLLFDLPSESFSWLTPHPTRAQFNHFKRTTSAFNEFRKGGLGF